MRRYVVYGLVFCAGPLFAQEYIDLELERARRSAAEAPAATPPPTTYPRDPAPVAADTEPAGNLGYLYYQLQLLRQEIMELRGRVEEQDYAIRQLKQQNLDRYQDIDRRLNQGAEGDITAPGAADGADASGRELPGEADAYRGAYSLVRSQRFAEAVIAFRQFLRDFPEGRYAPNAHYWLGELYLVAAPPDPESSRREFVLLVEQYPDNSKVPDALYKLGKIYFERGDRDRAREHLERVIREYEDGDSSAVKLARDFLGRNF